VVSVLEWHLDQEPDEWAAARSALACSARIVFSLRSLRNRQSRAARFHSDSAGSIAPVKVPGSEPPWHAAKLRLMGIFFPMQARKPWLVPVDGQFSEDRPRIPLEEADS